VKKVDKLLISF